MKKCRFCSGEKYLLNYKFLFVSIEGNKLVFDYNNFYFPYVKFKKYITIKYCPICKKKLKKEV